MEHQDRDRQTGDALTEADRGQLVSHQTVAAWVRSVNTAAKLPSVVSPVERMMETLSR